MLIVVPFVLIFLGLRSKEIIKFKPLYILVGMLILWGFLVNCDQLKNSVLLTKQSNAERVEFLKNNTREKDVIIFQSNPLMEHCGPLFFERVYMVSKNRGGDLVKTLSSLKLKGITRCFYWTNNRDFSANFPEENDYALEEFVFSAKNFSRHYLIKIEL
jgi:hypothetical protein